MTVPNSLDNDGLGAATPVVSVSPVVLAAPGRGEALLVRVSAPTTGTSLPVVVFSHGFGWSADSYAPLVNFWASHGFVVVQPTHLDARTRALPPQDPRTPDIWRSRIKDLRSCVDHLELVEAAVPGLTGRVDSSRLAVAGHSWGGQSASTLLGARVLDPAGRPGEDMFDPRVRAGVLLSTTGSGGADLSPFAAEHFPFMSPSFSTLTTPTLVVAGDQDDSPLSTRGPDWFTDIYTKGPGADTLLTLFGAQHSLGGIAGHAVAETTDEHPERVALIQRLTTAYLRDVLCPGDTTWSAVAGALQEATDPMGRLDTKGRPGAPAGVDATA